MASLCTPFIYLLPFSLLIYLFLFGSFLLFYGCVRRATLCLISTFSSADKSFVWRYLFCEIVLVTRRRAFWRNTVAQTQTHTHFAIRGSTARQARSLCFPLFISSLHSLLAEGCEVRKARELFPETLFEIHLQTLKSLLLFNHTLSKDF